MKKYLLFLVAAMLATVARAAVGDTFTYEELNFVVISEDDHTAAVGINRQAPGDITIPSVVKYGESSYSVTEIGEKAFWVNDIITSVTIPNSVTSIEQQAFAWCDNLASVTIPNSVTEIGQQAFQACKSLTSITIPNSVTEIGETAFWHCENLASVTIPNSVTKIGDGAFEYCINMTEIIVEDGNPNYSSDNGVLFNVDKTTLIHCPGGKKGEYTIPNSVTAIEIAAFAFCKSLTSVTIPNSVTEIGNTAFGYCENLTSITIPNSVTEIREYTFEFCENLTSITIPNSVTKIGDAAFYRCESLSSVNIPNSVTSIGEYAFAHCYTLSSITIPSSVTTIGMVAFMGCINMTELVVEDGNPNYSSDNGVLFNVDKTKLIQCSGGKTGEYTIPNSVTAIEYAAFAFCKSLTSVTIPSSVNHIEESAFHGCNKLQTIYNRNPTPQSLGLNVFYEVPRDVVVYIPKGSLDKYTEAKGWNYFTDFREMGTSGVDEIVTDAEVPVDAYNLQGVEVLRGAAASELSKLPAGLYIVRQGKSIKKMIVK